MELSAFFQKSLQNPWVVLGLSVFLFIFGWTTRRWISKLVVGLLKRTQLIQFISSRLKLPDTEAVVRRINKTTSLFVILLTAWAAWQTLNSHSGIAEFIQGLLARVTGFTQLEEVTFTLNILLIGLATFALFKAFSWIKAGYQLLSSRIEEEEGKRLRGLKVQKLEVFTDRELTGFLLAVSRYSRYGINIFLLLIYLTAVFSVFPQTRGTVTDILHGIFQAVEKAGQGLADYLPSLLNLFVIILFTYYGLKLIRFIFAEIEKGSIVFSGFYPEWTLPTYQLVRFLVIALALVIAFPYLPGSSSPAFQGVSVFIGLLFSLGSTSVVANIVSGVVLTYTRAFRIGDRVKIADTIGDVIEKRLLVTRIRTIKNVEVTIPNGLVLGSHIINYSAVSQERGLVLNTTVTLGYDIPWRLVHETLIKAAQATEGILPEPRPFVLQTSLNDFYVSYELNAYTDKPNRMALVYSALHQNIQDFCNEAGIEILSPHYGALRDGNRSTIPPEHLPKDSQAKNGS